MKFSKTQIAGSIETARRKAAIWSLAFVVLFTLAEAHRGAHYFDKIKYNLSLWAYVSSLVLVIAGLAALLNALLLKYHQEIQIPKISSRLWMVWAICGAAFVWLGVDKMLAMHEKISFALVKSVPFLRDVLPSQIDGAVLAAYGLLAVPVGIVLLRRLLMSGIARRYFIWGFILMAISVGHDATENKFGLRGTFIDGETIEKLTAMFSAWAFACAFLAVTAVLVTKVLLQWYGAAEEDVPVVEKAA